MTNKVVMAKVKAALLAGAVTALSACAHDATSDLSRRSLDAVKTEKSLVDLGYAAAARGDHSTAIQYFRSAHAKNLAYSSARGAPLLGLGQSLLAIGQNTDAADVFVKAAKAGAGAPALRGLAQAQLYIGQPGLAVESARRAVQLDPNDAKSMGVLGVAMDVLGDHQGAAAIYADAMTQFPGSLALASNHGLSMVMTGDMQTGIRLLEDVVRDPRATARDRQNLSLAYALSGDYDKAAALSAIDLDVSGVRANLLYADMLRAMNPRARLSALVVGAQAPKTDSSQNANAVYVRGDNAAWVEESVRRLLPVEGAPDLAGVPPLMDPTGWAVQVAAYRKLEHLAPGWAYLSSKYASILGGLEPRRSEVTHPPATEGPVGFFFRLNAGPLRDKQEALDICAQLKERGAECWVRPPTAGEGRLPNEELAKSNAAETAFVASSDYNAVVNQFARAMVMKSRQDAPAKTRDLPAVMMASSEVASEPLAAPVPQLEAPAPTTAAQETKAVSTLSAEEKAAKKADIIAASQPLDARDTPASIHKTVKQWAKAEREAEKFAQAKAKRRATKAAELASVGQPLMARETPTSIAEDVAVWAEAKAEEERLARLAAEEKAAKEAAIADASVPVSPRDTPLSIKETVEQWAAAQAERQAVTEAQVAEAAPALSETPDFAPGATVQSVAAVTPAAAPLDVEKEDPAKLDALKQVFDAMDEPAQNAASEQNGESEAPAPGKLLPAMQRFNDAPQNLTFIGQSGGAQPGFEAAGKVKDTDSGAVIDGVY